MEYVVFGYDGRQRALHQLLCARGADSRLVTDVLPQRGMQPVTWVLPVPSLTEGGYIRGQSFGPEALQAAVRPGDRVIYASGDGADPLQGLNCARRNVLRVEDYTLANAHLTAQGALGVALTHLDQALYGAEVLVLGFGRIGKELCRLLAACGALVSVGARAHHRAAIAAAGYRYVDPAAIDGPYVLICNTVPAPILDVEPLAGSDVLLLELASAPYGYDGARARELGLRSIACPGLPGRLYPVSAARALLQFGIDEEGR